MRRLLIMFFTLHSSSLPTKQDLASLKTQRSLVKFSELSCCCAAGSPAGEDGESEGPVHRGDGCENEGDVRRHVRWHLCLEDFRFHQKEAGCRGWPCPRYVLSW